MEPLRKTEPFAEMKFFMLPCWFYRECVSGRILSYTFSSGLQLIKEKTPPVPAPLSRPEKLPVFEGSRSLLIVLLKGIMDRPLPVPAHPSIKQPGGQNGNLFLGWVVGGGWWVEVRLTASTTKAHIHSYIKDSAGAGIHGCAGQ